MRDVWRWNLDVGTWWGVPVRLHASFLIVALALLLPGENSNPLAPVGTEVGTPANSPGEHKIDAPDNAPLAVAASAEPRIPATEPAAESSLPPVPWYALPYWYRGTLLLVLLASLLWHETAHLLVALRLGSRQEPEIVLWPLGGWTIAPWSADARVELCAASSGLLANLFICLGLLPLLLLLVPNGDWAALVNPLTLPARPQLATSAWGTLVPTLELAFWVNWCLVLFNLLPAAPLDGARLARSGLALMLDSSRAKLHSGHLALGTVLGVLGAAWLVRTTPQASAVVPLLVLSVTLFFVSRQWLLAPPVFAEESERGGRPAEVSDRRKLETDRWRDNDESLGEAGSASSSARGEVEEAADPAGSDLFDDDLLSREPADAGSSENSPTQASGALRRWLDDRREARIERQRQIEAWEESRVDEILARLHQLGLASLTSADRQLLERVSARYRNRQNH